MLAMWLNALGLLDGRRPTSKTGRWERRRKEEDLGFAFVAWVCEDSLRGRVDGGEQVAARYSDALALFCACARASTRTQNQVSNMCTPSVDMIGIWGFLVHSSPLLRRTLERERPREREILRERDLERERERERESRAACM